MAPPVISAETPTGVAPAATSFGFTVTDDAAGVDTAETRVTITYGSVEYLAWDADAAAPGFSGSRVPVADGYTYSITPSSSLPAGFEVTVDISVADLSGKTASAAFVFTVEVLSSEPNWSFELPGAASGDALSWTHTETGGAEDAGALADGSSLESFENGWSANETARLSFVGGDLQRFPLIEGYESFEHDWDGNQLALAAFSIYALGSEFLEAFELGWSNVAAIAFAPAGPATISESGMGADSFTTGWPVTSNVLPPSLVGPKTEEVEDMNWTSVMVW